MESFPKVRKKMGRPRKIPEPPDFGVAKMSNQDREMLSGSLGMSFPTHRTQANAHYADKARQVVGLFIEQGVQIPEDPLRAASIRIGWDWILTKKTVLAELGRMLVEEPTQEDVMRFRRTVEKVADKHKKMGAKGAVAYIRGVRLGSMTTQREERVASLHHELNNVVNLHRQRYPESSWADIQRAVERTADVVKKKVR
jgi:hypothetical protein